MIPNQMVKSAAIIIEVNQAIIHNINGNIITNADAIAKY